MGGVKEELVARLDLAIHEDDATTSCKPDESSRKRQSGCTRGVMELRCAELEEKIKKIASGRKERQVQAAHLQLRCQALPPTVAASLTHGCRCRRGTGEGRGHRFNEP